MSFSFSSRRNLVAAHSIRSRILKEASAPLTARDFLCRSPFDPFEDTERFTPTHYAPPLLQVAAHSIRSRILKADVFGDKQRVHLVAAHSIRSRILKDLRLHPALVSPNRRSPFDPFEDTESGRLERVMGNTVCSRSPFDPFEDTERARRRVSGVQVTLSQPIRSVRGY